MVAVPRAELIVPVGREGVVAVPAVVGVRVRVVAVATDRLHVDVVAEARALVPALLQGTEGSTVGLRLQRDGKEFSVQGVDPNGDPGTPAGPATVLRGSVFTRSYSRATVALDCSTFNATITFT